MRNIYRTTIRNLSIDTLRIVDFINRRLNFRGSPRFTSKVSGLSWQTFHETTRERRVNLNLPLRRERSPPGDKTGERSRSFKSVVALFSPFEHTSSLSQVLLVETNIDFNFYRKLHFRRAIETNVLRGERRN